MAADLKWFNKAGGYAPVDEETGGAPPLTTAPKPRKRGEFGNTRTDTMVARNSGLSAFLNKVGSIRKELNGLQEKFKNLGDTYEDSFGAATPEQIKTFKADLETAMGDIKASTQKLVNSVRSLQQEISDKEQDPNLTRQKRAKSAELEQELILFRDKVFKFQTRMKDDRRKEYRSKLKAFLNKDPTDQEVDKWAESGDDQALYAALLTDQSRPAVQKVLSDIQERNRAAKALQASIEQLYQQFNDMQTLVHAQGEQLGSITQRLEKAQDYTSTGVKVIRQAASIKTTTARTQIMFYGIVAVAVIVVTALILGIVLPMVR